MINANALVAYGEIKFDKPTPVTVHKIAIVANSSKPSLCFNPFFISAFPAIIETEVNNMISKETNIRFSYNSSDFVSPSKIKPISESAVYAINSNRILTLYFLYTKTTIKKTATTMLIEGIRPTLSNTKNEIKNKSEVAIGA